MILIAENLNSSIPAVKRALAEHDEAWLKALIAQLDASPAAYLDINAGIFHEQETAYLTLLAELALAGSRKPLVLDSPDPAVLCSVCRSLPADKMKDRLIDPGQPGMILNSITLEENRYQAMLNLALTYKAGLVALLMDAGRMPQGVQERLRIADMLVSRLTSSGIPAERIFLDPMVRPVSTDDQAGLEALQVIKTLRVRYPDVHVVVGLSNVSYGLPARKYLNQAFLLQAMAMGLDSAILNTLDYDLVALYRAGLSLLGQDEYCMDYLNCYRPS
ncbi:MAG: dihydropteroate synthase [Clostridiaceae bacterium]|nr:dihydropteroate synthase [Clostridiaceae bacterium]